MYLPEDNFIPRLKTTGTPMTIHRALQAKQLARGVTLKMTMINNPEQVYYMYIPRAACKTSSVFVTVHGVQRMAKEQIDAFIPFAEQYGITMIAPLFLKNRFPDYQRLGLGGKGRRADLVFEEILDEVSLLTGINTKTMYSFGFSGGGQFVHRYAMTRPERVKRMVLAAPGWYTFPDMDRKYPYGIARSGGMRGVSMEANKFLNIPASVLVGEKDNIRDRQLRKGERIDLQQGRNRIERGETWIKAMEKSCHSHGIHTQYKFQILANSNHSFLNCMDNGGMGGIAFDFLLGTSL